MELRLENVVIKQNINKNVPRIEVARSIISSLNNINQSALNS